ncbi:MAG: type IX secretion system protein PorD [Flavobacteriales bacterium]
MSRFLIPSFRIFCSSLVMLLGTLGCFAQELNCRVQVIAPQISNVEGSIFESLEESIQEFMNGRRWTNEDFTFEERIECNMQITLSEAPSATSFKGSIQVQSSRPVFNSDYNTPMLLVNDGEFEIIWDGSSTIQFSPDQFRDNLSSVLAYYSYMVIGMDYDSMGLEGGTPYYLKAQTIVANAQNSGPSGWKASQGQQNRYWLVENMLAQTFRPVRNCLYYYHRMGLDRLFDDVERGRLTMADALIEMRQTHRIRPSSYNLQLFFLAKSDEILKVFGPAPNAEKTRLLPVLKQMDPGNISKYDSILG